MDGGAALSVAKVIGFDSSCSGKPVPGNWQWARMNEGIDQSRVGEGGRVGGACAMIGTDLESVQGNQ